MKHCPECNVEYVDMAIRCSDCDVELTLGPPTPEEHPDPKIETVYVTGDPALVAMAKSLKMRESSTSPKATKFRICLACGGSGVSIFFAARWSL
jgi:hypothetical protein